jgi:hypothetical protein
MNDYNEKREKKGGFWSALAGLVRGGSSAAGSGFGSAGSAAGGLGGLFATKAGVVGMILGGATIAAGVGVVYNFIGPSSNPAYSPELFQNSYYEEESTKAGMERAKARDASAAGSSTLDMFKEQARKDGIGLDGESASGQPPDAASQLPGGAPSADAAAPEAPAAGQGAGAPKLQAASGFGSKGGGGGGSSIPRMQGGGGMSGGIGSQFSSVYRPPAQAVGGKTSGMTASAARVKNSPKYAVPNFNRKGAFGQAKFARNMGNSAKYSSDVGAKGQAGVPFDSAQQTGTGEVGTPETGTGLGGAGVSSGSKLKGNDPSLNSNEVTPPKVPEPENVSPWKAWTDRAMYGMLAATVLILITNMLAKFAKTTPWMYTAALITGYAAMAAAALVMVSGLMLMSKYGQKWAGAMYLVAGGMLMWQAYQALSGVGEAATKNGVDMGSMGKACPGYNQPQAFGNGLAANGGDVSKMSSAGWETTGTGADAKLVAPEGVSTVNGNYSIPNASGGGSNLVSPSGEAAGRVTPGNNVMDAGSNKIGTIDAKGNYVPDTPAVQPQVQTQVQPSVQATTEQVIGGQNLQPPPDPLHMESQGLQPNSAVNTNSTTPMQDAIDKLNGNSGPTVS